MSNRGLLIIVIVLLVGIFATLVIQHEQSPSEKLENQLDKVNNFIEEKI